MQKQKLQEELEKLRMSKLVSENNQALLEEIRVKDLVIKKQATQLK
jgi:hypothetical protein